MTTLLSLMAAVVLGGEGIQPDQFQQQFLRLCDVACREVNAPDRRIPYYQDSYAIRALAVAYDMTGKAEYLNACRWWSDRMLAFQKRMTPRGAYSLKEITRALKWMADNQAGRGAKTAWDYNAQWGSKMGGLPFHMYVYARHLPDGASIAAAADQELSYQGGLLAGARPLSLTQLVCFAMMSYAERLRPGELYRSDRVAAAPAAKAVPAAPGPPATPLRATWPGPSPGAAEAKLEAGGLVLQNDLLSASWTLAGDRFLLRGFTDRRGGSTLKPADGEPFKIVLSGGQVLPASQMRPLGDLVLARLEPRPNAVRIAERSAGWIARLELATGEGTLAAAWQAEIRDGSNYIRQSVTLLPDGKAPAVEAIVLAELDAGDAKPCGEVDGSPILAGNWFLGAEHPMAANRVEKGKAICSVGLFGSLRPRSAYTRSMALGILPAGQGRRAFLYYLERERPRPYDPFLHYNSWYDIAWVDRKMDERGCLTVIDLFGRELVERRKVRFDSAVFDDGWDDNRTLWLFHDGFPRGFTPLAELARKYHSAVGVWLSPWGGYSKAKEERMKYGRQQGFEMNDRGFSLAGPKYYTRFRAACADMVKLYDVNYFKFDGIGASVSAPGAGPYAGDIDALLRLVADLRQLRPDLFVNITTGTWPSPYWLFWGDSIWRSGDDMGFHGPGPKRQQWITYRDMITYQGVVRRGPLYPINSLMTQGIAHARLGSANLPPDLKDMADEIRSFFASGTQLQELYITPQMLTPAMWDLLAEGAAWSRRNADVLADVHMIGGDPGRQQVYGWAAWSPRQGMLALRNPAPVAGSLAVDLRPAFELPSSAPTSYRLVSPWKDAKAGQCVLQAGQAHKFDLAPFEVLVFDAIPVE